MEYDLVYLARGMLFLGARHVDGRGFDSEANRPTNLQIPLARKSGGGDPGDPRLARVKRGVPHRSG